jgi:hypothetical protein
MFDSSLSSATADYRRGVTRFSTESFYFRVQRIGMLRITFREVKTAVRNVLRIMIVISALAGLLVVQGMAAKPGVLSSSTR